MKELKLDSFRIEDLFKCLKSCLATDDSRPILKWIKVEVEKTKITAISVDGYMLCTYTIDIEDNDEEEPYSFFIKPFNIPKTKSGSEITINCENEKFITITIRPYTSKDTITYSIEQPISEFIKWKQIIAESDKDLSIYFDARRLRDILKGFVNSYVNNMVCLSFRKNKNGTIQYFKKGKQGVVLGDNWNDINTGQGSAYVKKLFDKIIDFISCSLVF